MNVFDLYEQAKQNPTQTAIAEKPKEQAGWSSSEEEEDVIID